jgi:RES domain-containing protein
LTFSVWRIATDTPGYTADDLTGEGARVSGGRWNRPGTRVLYTSSSIALACLETLVNLQAGDLPLNRYLIRLDIADAVWRAAWSADPKALVGRDAIPEGKVSLDAGDAWVAGRSTVLAIVPSVVVPEETNILINPLHADASGIRAHKLRRWTYDSRLRAGT